jgi:hypothetical protein
MAMRFVFPLAADAATNGSVDVGDDEREKTNKPLSGKILRVRAENRKDINMINAVGNMEWGVETTALQ